MPASWYLSSLTTTSSVLPSPSTSTAMGYWAAVPELLAVSKSTLPSAPL